MNGLLEIFEIVLPLLGTTGLGWIAGRFFGFPDKAENVLTRYVLWLGGPAVLLLAVADSALSDLLDAHLLLASFLTYLVVFGSLLFFHRVALGRELGESAFAAFSVAKFNLIIIGLPVVFSIVGTKGAPAVIVNAFLSYFLLTSTTIFLYGLSQGSGREESPAAGALWQGIRDTFTNPLILGSLTGLVLLLLGIRVPTALRTPLHALGDSVVPVGLIAVGMSVRNIAPSAWNLEIWLMALTKMLVVPAIAIGFALALDLNPVPATSMVLLFGVPSAVVTYVLARDFGVYERQASEIVVLTTILGAVFIPLNAWICRIIWPLAAH